MWMVKLAAICLFLLSVGSQILCSTISYVNWMHIQKTSSWMGDFLLLAYCHNISELYHNISTHSFLYDSAKYGILFKYNCSIFNKQYGFHLPYGKSAMNETTVSLFRKPIKRLISAYLFNDGSDYIKV